MAHWHTCVSSCKWRCTQEYTYKFRLLCLMFCDSAAIVGFKLSEIMTLKLLWSICMLKWIWYLFISAYISVMFRHIWSMEFKCASKAFILCVKITRIPGVWYADAYIQWFACEFHYTRRSTCLDISTSSARVAKIRKLCHIRVKYSRKKMRVTMCVQTSPDTQIKIRNYVTQISKNSRKCVWACVCRPV